MDNGVTREGSAPTGLRSISPNEHFMADLVKQWGGLPPGTKKSKFLAAVKQAAPSLKVSEKCLYLLDQLMAFSPERDWEHGRRPIVWPSNEMLCDTLGIQTRSLQYRLKSLRDAGLIVSSYGPQERRYGRRGVDGHIVEAYGFDLSPLAIRHAEFQAIAERVREKRAQRQSLRRRKTIAVKALRMICATAFELELDNVEWSVIDERGRALAIEARGQRDIEPLRAVVERLESMRADVGAHFQTQAQLWTSQQENINSAPEDAKTCTTVTTTNHLQFKTLNTVVNHERSSTRTSSQFEIDARSNAPRLDPDDPIEKTITKYHIQPSMIATLSPFFRSLLPVNEPIDWKTIGDAGYKAFRLVGISEHAWEQAVTCLGREAAAVLVVIVICKRQELHKPGGYFRGMVEKGRNGELNLGPTLYALRDKANAAAKPPA